MTPAISCLLTSYNRPEMLQAAIDSVLGQTCQDYELIILDDNSGNEGVTQVLSRHWANPQVIIYKARTSEAERPRTTRYATLINIGLRLASGTYVTYLTDDDLYFPHRFERMLALLAQGHDAVYGPQVIMTFDGLKDDMRITRGVLNGDNPAARRVDHCSVMHTLASALAVGGWDDDPQYWREGDARFWAKMTAAGYEFWPIHGEPLDAHRIHSQTIGNLGEPY